jgi:cysteinyl-tRNA synthetase
LASLSLKNTYTKSLETFAPPHDRKVTLYSCGPTVYSYAHIGNFRSFLMADVLRRALEQHGFEVRHVMNITDVGHMTEDHLADATGEDKLAKAARDLGWDPFVVAAHFERAFAEDAKALRLKNYLGDEADDRSLHPRATDHIPEMLAMIQTLLERRYAYVDGDGQVYFHVAAFPEYGRLSGKIMDELASGARVAVRSEKRDPRDFALWKVDKKHLMQWNPHGPDGWRGGEYERYRALVAGGVDDRVGAGFPGWHIECSAMARACLGAIVDIHTGGEDNIFPHHECEIAQSYGARVSDDTPKSFVRCWVHSRHLLVDNAKMSKRDATFMTARDLFDPRGAQRVDLAERLEALGFNGGKVPPAVLRFALISSPFDQPINFTLDSLRQAKSSVERLQTLYQRLRGDASAAPGDEVKQLVAAATAAFDAALGNDLNTAQALAEAFKVVTAANQRELGPGDQASIRAFLDRVNGVFDVLDPDLREGSFTLDELTLPDGARLDVDLPQQPLTEEDVRLALARRRAARAARDFGLADAIRSSLVARAIEIDDTPTGARWRRK